MMYTLIISLLIEKPFYLLSSKSFSFQIVSEFIDIFVKFSNFMSRGGAFDPLFCLEGMAFVHNDCPGEGGCSLQVVSRRFVPGVDTCISHVLMLNYNAFHGACKGTSSIQHVISMAFFVCNSKAGVQAWNQETDVSILWNFANCNLVYTNGWF